MAMKVEKIILGADVSQEWIDLALHGDEDVQRIDNTRKAIDQALKALPGAALAVEATNTYHELLVERALKLGLSVYVISGYQLSHYAKSVGTRMRTDPIDAQLLARYLHREIDALRPFQPKSQHHQRLWRLLKRRARLVQFAKALRQSLTAIRELQRSLNSLLRRIKEVIAVIDRLLRKLAITLGWQADLQRLRSIPGIGPLSAYALLLAYRAGHFTHRDPYIAFMGLDVRTKDSGKHKGKRKLTKQGDPEYRRLLYNAAMAAARTRYYRQTYQQALARGFSTTAAYVIVARKLARLAFALLKKQASFDHNQFKGAGVSPVARTI